MDMNVINGVIRALLPPIIAFLVAKGTLPVGAYDAVITGIVSLLSAIWSIKSNMVPKA